MLSTKITKRVKMKKNNNNHLDFLVWAVTLVIPLVLLQCKLNLLNDIENCRRGWNLTAKFSKDHDENILIFSRVPKTASLTINAIIKKLKTINNYTAYGAIDGMPDGGEGGEYVYEPSTYMRKMLIGAVLKEKEKEKDRPFIYTRHQNFLNFTEFFPNITKVQPIYMSFVRHPVDRVISWYYYIRNPEYQFDDYGDLKTDLMKPHRLLKESIEECYYKQRRGCQIFDGMSVYSGKRDSSYISQMAFFCGHMQECDKFETKQLYNIALKVKKKFTILPSMFKKYFDLFSEFRRTFCCGWSHRVFQYFDESIRKVPTTIFLWGSRSHCQRA